MDTTEKNGQPSMEEILASIRRIIAEEPAGGGDAAGRRRVITLNPDSSMDEHADFELPAIFRSPAQPTPDKSTPLFGRLTDAIRGTGTGTVEARAPRPDDEHAAETGEGPGWAARAELPHPALSSLKPVRVEPFPRHVSAEPAEIVNGESHPHAAAADGPQAAWKFGRTSAPPPGVEDEIKRVMAPFKDTRFRQMAPSPSSPEPAQAPPAPLSEPATSASHVDFGAIIPAHLGAPAVPLAEPQRRAETAAELPPHPWSEPAAPDLRAATEAILHLPSNPLTQGYPAASAARPATAEEFAVAPPVLRPPHAGAPTGTIEDTTAELLRPMLRQWLADNMPRMVEKALHIEVAESVKTPGRKLNGA